MNDQQKNKIWYLDWVGNAAGLFCFAGVLLFCYQVLMYLKRGEWIEFPLSVLASFGPENFVSWLNNPTSWLGIHKILSGALELIPLSLFAIFVGVVIGVVMPTYEAEINNA